MSKVISYEFRMNNSTQHTVSHLECGHERVFEYGYRPADALCWVCPPEAAPQPHAGKLVSDLVRAVNSVDMRELSPDAPRYTSAEDRCRTQSCVRPDHRCILQAGHVKRGFISCQFSPEDKDCEEGCIAGIGTDAPGENGYQCRKPVVGDDNLCAEHEEAENA